MTFRSYCFVINPNSGSKSKQKTLLGNIKKVFSGSAAKYEVYMTMAPGHAAQTARMALEKGFDCVIAAGGDGTINEIVQVLAGTPVALGIIPLGSGNGLARSLDIPLTLSSACRMLLNGCVRKIDLGMVNGEYFANVAGIGIDEKIGTAFNRAGARGRRGMMKYFLVGIPHFLFYRPLEYYVQSDKFSGRIKPCTLTFANGKQFGSGAEIAPGADMSDGLLDFVAVKHIRFFSLPKALYKFFTGRIAELEYADSRRVQSVLVVGSEPILYHLDGESRSGPNELVFSVKPGMLNVIVPQQNLNVWDLSNLRRA
ncbi:MAG: diacylglycerol kinase family protein [Elusimicrobiaceae bacterium]